MRHKLQTFDSGGITIHILLGIILVGCNSRIKYDEKEDVLIHIANHYIEQEEYRMLKIGERSIKDR